MYGCCRHCPGNSEEIYVDDKIHTIPCPLCQMLDKEESSVLE